MDKYNEKYDNMANASGGGNRKKDNFSKKQKLTQKSQQRKSQQYSTKKETEAEKLRRLELERARKQQLKVLIPDEIVVSELAQRLKVTASEVIKKLVSNPKFAVLMREKINMHVDTLDYEDMVL